MTDQNHEKFSPEQSAPGAPFTVWQSHLAQKLGVSIEELRDLRDAHLVRDVDWRIGEGNHAEMTEAAALKLAGLFLPAEGAQAGPVAQAARAVPARMVTDADVPMRVHRAGARILNPRLIEARLEADGGAHKAGEVVCVRVKDNKQFRIEDAITARHSGGNFYDLSSKVPKRRA